MTKYILGVFVSSATVVAAYIFYLYAGPNLLDRFHDLLSGAEVIERGSLYGITIGESKDETYRRLVADDPTLKINVSGFEIENAPDYFRLADVDSRDKLMKVDYWHLLLSEARHNVLRAHFSDGKLIKIIHVWGPKLPHTLASRNRTYIRFTDYEDDEH